MIVKPNTGVKIVRCSRTCRGTGAMGVDDGVGGVRQQIGEVGSARPAGPCPRLPAPARNCARSGARSAVHSAATKRSAVSSQRRSRTAVASPVDEQHVADDGRAMVAAARHASAARRSGPRRSWSAAPSTCRPTNPREQLQVESCATCDVAARRVRSRRSRSASLSWPSHRNCSTPAPAADEQGATSHVSTTDAWTPLHERKCSTRKQAKVPVKGGFYKLNNLFAPP